MREREAWIGQGEHYRLPSSTVVAVESIDKDAAHAHCHYVGPTGALVRDGMAQPDVTLTLRFLQKFARRVWA